MLDIRPEFAFVVVEVDLIGQPIEGPLKNERTHHDGQEEGGGAFGQGIVRRAHQRHLGHSTRKPIETLVREVKINML